MKVVEIVTQHKTVRQARPETSLLIDGSLRPTSEGRNAALARLLSEGYRHLSTVTMTWTQPSFCHEVRDTLVLAGREELGLIDLEA